MENPARSPLDVIFQSPSCDGSLTLQQDHVNPLFIPLQEQISKIKSICAFRNVMFACSFLIYNIHSAFHLQQQKKISRDYRTVDKVSYWKLNGLLAFQKNLKYKTKIILLKFISSYEECN